MPSETDKAYAAGIIDGEGSIFWGGNPQSLTVSVSMSKPEVVEWLATKFGGSAHEYPSKHGPVYYWSLNCGQLKGLLEDIKPYIVLKKDHVMVAIAIAATYRTRSSSNIPKDEEEEWNRALVLRYKLGEILSEMNPRRSPLNPELALSTEKENLS